MSIRNMMIGGAGATAPDAPTIGTATTSAGGSASVTFTAPANNGGSAITSFTVTSSPGGVTGTGASSPIAVSGLTNGTAYTFTVTATNAVGTSPASAASNSVTPVNPELYAFSSVTFTAGATSGADGPNIATMRSAAGSPSWAASYMNMSTNGILLWTCPQTATYRIGISGASGILQDYSPTNNGNDSYGRGAQFVTDVPLTYNTVYKILIGQLPRTQSGYDTAYAGQRAGGGSQFTGGGGGTFFATSADTPIACAGGGGTTRAGYTFVQANVNARTDFNAIGNPGGASGAEGGDSPQPQKAGSNGGGAAGTNYPEGTGGGGFYTNSVGTDNSGGAGNTFARGFIGGGVGAKIGSSPNNPPADGGFGGGGHGGWGGSAGGGGYSGGGPGTNHAPSGYGGGGGNYNSGTLVGSVTADRIGPGYVTITKL